MPPNGRKKYFLLILIPSHFPKSRTGREVTFLKNVKESKLTKNMFFGHLGYLSLMNILSNVISKPHSKYFSVKTVICFSWTIYFVRTMTSQALLINHGRYGLGVWGNPHTTAVSCQLVHKKHAKLIDWSERFDLAFSRLTSLFLFEN